MKFKKTFGLISLGLLAALSIGGGLLASRSNVKKISAAGAFEGSIALEFQNLGEDQYWDDANAKIAAHIYNSTDPGYMQDFWTDLLETTSGTHHYVLNYNCTYDPFVNGGANTKIDIYRFNPEVTDAADAFAKGNYWNHAADLSLGTMAYVYGWNDAISMIKYAVCATSNSWAFRSDNVLRKAKMVGETFEMYGNVTLADGDEFKIVSTNGTKEGTGYCGNYEAYSKIADNFSHAEGWDPNIVCTKGGTFSFFYNISTPKVYITDPVAAEADEWAKYFLETVVCDADGKELPTGWDDAAGEYAKLSNDAKDYVYAAEANETGTYTEHAVARYDAALRSHPTLTRFIKTGNGESTRSNGLTPYHYNEFNPALIIVVISGLTIAGVVAVLVIRKRKQHN